MDLVAQATDGTGLDAEVVALILQQLLLNHHEDLSRCAARRRASFGGGKFATPITGVPATRGFRVFRIYADAKNEPADYSESNVPFQPKHHFPVDLGGVKEGDFTMVFGFPGRTEQYLTSDAVTYVVEHLNPARIEMRDASLAVVNAARASSPALRIAYADKQSSIANAWKKWIGQNTGLNELDAVGKSSNSKRSSWPGPLQRIICRGCS